MITQTNHRPAINAYRRRILAMLRPLLAGHGPFPRRSTTDQATGSLPACFRTNGSPAKSYAVDVQRRAKCHAEPLIYDGTTLPFDDRSFDLVYAMDVLHHCTDPRASLRELARCSSRYVLIKDHTYRRPLGRLALGLLDEIGNRRFGVPCRYEYQQGWEWSEWLQQEGFAVAQLCPSGPLPCRPAGTMAQPIGVHCVVEERGSVEFCIAASARRAGILYSCLFTSHMVSFSEVVPSLRCCFLRRTLLPLGGGGEHRRDGTASEECAACFGCGHRPR